MRRRTILFCMFLILYKAKYADCQTRHKYLLLPTKRDALTVCTTMILQRLYSIEETLIFVFNNNQNFLIPTIIKNPRMFITNKFQIKRMSLNFYTNYIIYTEDATSLNATMLQLKQSKIWNESESPRGKYVLITSAKTNLEQMFETLWRFDIMNVILVQFQDNYSTTQLYMSNPFSRGAECGKKSRLLVSQKCSENTTMQFYKTFRNVRECNLKLLTESNNTLDLKSGGSYAVLRALMDLIGEVLKKNISLVVTLNKYAILSNHSEDISVASAVSRATQILEQSDITKLFYRDEVIWAIPKPAKISNMKLIAMVFEKQLWGIIVLVTIITFIILWLFTKHPGERQDLKSLSRCLLIVCRILFGGADNREPNSIAMKMVLLFYIFLAIIINCLFQAQLVSVLTQPGYESPITTLEELAETEVTVLSYKAFSLGTTGNDENHAFVKLCSRIIDQTIVNLTKSLILVANNRQFVTPIGERALGIHPKQKPMINKISHNQGLLAVEASFALRKGHYLMATINEIGTRVVESGFHEYVISKAAGLQYVQPEDDTNVVLTLSHLCGAFTWWGVGLLAATGIFIMELLTVRINMRRLLTRSSSSYRWFLKQEN